MNNIIKKLLSLLAKILEDDEIREILKKILWKMATKAAEYAKQNSGEQGASST